MIDVIYVGLMFLFFIACSHYVRWVEKL